MTLEAFHPDLALASHGLLRTFNDAGVLVSADVHVATRFGRLLEEDREPVLLAAALAVAAVRHGSVCVDLATVAEHPVEDGVSLDWPSPEEWLAEVAGSPLVREQVLRLEGTLLYLDRYWREEGQVCDDLVARLSRRPPEVDEDLLEQGIARVFPLAGYDEQRTAVLTAARQWTTVLTGGPGTGKTTAVAGLLTLVAEQQLVHHGRPPRIALCAPTGKAAGRLQEAVAEAAAGLADPADRARVQGLTASTLHRLLGWRPDSSTRFRHDRGNRLPYDVVVVDEASMVSLTMMARLLEALRPDTRLVLVGDPDQLSSVEAGAVLADLVAGLATLEASPVVALHTTHRFGATIGTLAEALRQQDADAVLATLADGAADLEFIDPDDAPAMAGLLDDVVAGATRMRRAAEAGDAEAALVELAGHRLLCAHREGPYGVSHWNRQVELGVSDRLGVATYDEWYAGRPILITTNDRGQRLSNGDMGVALRLEEDRLRVVLAEPERRELAPSRLSEVQTVHAMTVHKAQGSQAGTVTVVVPPEDSRLLSRELFYTAVTRAQSRLRVIGKPDWVRAAVSRNVQRASGLEARLSAACAAAPGRAT